MIYLWRSISRLGVSENTDFRLASRIILSNQFGVVISALTFIFMILAMVNGNYNLIPYLVLLLISGTIWLLNTYGHARFARLLTSLLPGVGLFALNLSIKYGPAGSFDILHYATPRMIIVGSMALPFTMFLPAERKYVIISVLTILGLAFGYDKIHELLHIDHVTLGFNDKFYGVIMEDAIVLSIIVLLASGYLFKLGHQYDLKSKAMLDEALHQTEQMKKNEEALKKTLTELEVSKKKDEERNWVSKGLADIVGVIQSGEDDKKIYDKLLSSLVKYVGVNQGGLFIVEDGDDGKPVLNLTSFYAYERKKYLTKTIKPGEGLLGAAYFEGRRTYLKKVPAEYVTITSGLGEATPRELVIVPIKTNSQVEGLIELASLNTFQDHHFELLDQICETLASYIANNKTNVRTKSLLEKAQTMSEELKANEEEMRQNLEELTATQEAMSRKEQEYRDRIVELEAELALRDQGTAVHA